VRSRTRKPSSGLRPLADVGYDGALAGRRLSMKITRFLPLMAVLAALLVPAGSSLAAGLPELTPISAGYLVRVNGLQTSISARIELAPPALAGEQSLSFTIKSRFFNHHEVSQFDWANCRARPRHYEMAFDGLGIERRSTVDFDWDKQLATESALEQPVQIPLDNARMDALSMAMTARCWLRDGRQRLELPVVYRGGKRDLLFSVVGREPVETPLGTFDAVLLENRHNNARIKRTRVWVAPALDWFMVRMEHVENPVARGSMLLTDLVYDRTKMAPSAPATADTDGKR
jgi:hypothetical protein